MGTLEKEPFSLFPHSESTLAGLAPARLRAASSRAGEPGVRQDHSVQQTGAATLRGVRGNHLDSYTPRIKALQRSSNAK